MTTYYTGPEYTHALDGLVDLRETLLDMKSDLKNRRRFDSASTLKAQQAAVLAATVVKVVPEVVSTSPADEATGVSASAAISVTFNVRMDTDYWDAITPQTIYLLSSDAGANALTQSVAWSVNNTVATITLDGPLEAGKTYKLYVDLSVVGQLPGLAPRSTAGVSPADIGSNHAYFHATGFTVAA